MIYLGKNEDQLYRKEKVTFFKNCTGGEIPLALKRAKMFWWGRERDWGIDDNGEHTKV